MPNRPLSLTKWKRTFLLSVVLALQGSLGQGEPSDSAGTVYEVHRPLVQRSTRESIGLSFARRAATDPFTGVFVADCPSQGPAFWSRSLLILESLDHETGNAIGASAFLNLAEEIEELASLELAEYTLLFVTCSESELHDLTSLFRIDAEELRLEYLNTFHGADPRLQVITDTTSGDTYVVFTSVPIPYDQDEEGPLSLASRPVEILRIAELGVRRLVSDLSVAGLNMELLGADLSAPDEVLLQDLCSLIAREDEALLSMPWEVVDPNADPESNWRGVSEEEARELFECGECVPYIQK